MFSSLGPQYGGGAMMGPQNGFMFGPGPMMGVPAPGMPPPEGMQAEQPRPIRQGPWKPLYLVYANLPVFLAPAAMFAVVFLSISLFEGFALGGLSVLLCTGISLSALALGKSKKWRGLAICCLLVTGLAFILATRIRAQFGATHERYNVGRWYTNVIASEDPDSRQDLSMITFSADSRVDKTMGVGYTDGTLWCVAPVVADSTSDFAGFWAVGQDCCHERGRFNCGDVRNPEAHSAVISLNQENNAKYMLAMAMSASSFEFKTPERPIFVHWTADALGYIKEQEKSVVDDVLGIAFFVLFLSLVAAASLPFLGLDFVSERMDFPNREEAQLMRIGCDKPSCCINGDRDDIMAKEPVIARELLHNKVYNSGEFFYDYIFHVCNNHMFISCTAAHPLHPFSKFERTIVCLVVCALIVWPVSLVEILFTTEGLVRSVVIVLLVTVPRTLIKAYLRKITTDDAQTEDKNVSMHKYGRPRDLVAAVRRGGIKASAAFAWELMVFAIIIMLTMITCVSSHKIMASRGYDPWNEIYENMDGLLFAFLLEPIVDLILPHQIHTSHGNPVIFGFTMHWITERDEGFVIPVMKPPARASEAAFKSYRSV